MIFSSEADFQKAVNEYLKKIPCLVFEHDEKGRYNKNKTHRQARPDLRIFYKCRAIFIELKHGKNTLSPAQVEYKQKLEAAGQKYYTCWTWDEFIGVMYTAFKHEDRPGTAASMAFKEY